MDELRGRTAIVTGASRGIGVYIARALAAERMHLALTARSQAPIEALAAELRGQDVRCIALPADIAEAGGRNALLTQAEAQLGPIDVLVNNAGLEANLRFADFSPEQITEMVHVDLIAPMLLTRQLLPALLARKTGHIVNIGSLAGKTASPFNVPYAAAKSGLILFTHSLRAELRGSGVGCSVVVPGYVAEAGMFANKVRDHGVHAPAIIGTSAPAAVGRAVVRALKNNSLEEIVAPGPIRLAQAFNQLFPEAFAWFIARVGAVEPFRKIAEAARIER